MAAFGRYGVKTKRKSEYDKEYSLTAALLQPRCFVASRGRKKGLFAHARDSLGIRIRMDIFRVLARSLPLYSRICVQRMMAESDVCGCCCLYSLSST